jgi:hypothetical protein
MGNIRLQVLLFCIVFSCICTAESNENSFTPDQVLYPITKIELSTKMSSDGPSGQVFSLYTCTENCMLDLTDNTALNNIARPTASIEEGSYRFVKVSSCLEGEDTYTASITGEVTIDGTKYFTDEVDGLNTSSAESVAIKFTECASYYELQEDLEVGDSVASSLRFIFDLTDIAWAKIGTESSGACFVKFGFNDSVCMGVPALIPIISSGTISKESYKIQEDGEYGANIILFMESDTFLGGFARRVFSPSSNALSGVFNSAIKRATFLSNGVYQFGTVGELSSELSKTKLSFSRFSRDTHTQPYLDAEGVEVNYTATQEE